MKYIITGAAIAWALYMAESIYFFKIFTKTDLDI